MLIFRRLIDFVTRGSDRPIRRLAAYYGTLAVALVLVMLFVPGVQRIFFGWDFAQAAGAPQLLPDGLTGGPSLPDTPAVSQLELTVTTLLSFLFTLSFMLPVSWVYMSTRKGTIHQQAIAQTMLILPIVVAGVVFVVQNSLALAFSLAGVVAAVRFRSSLRDTRDIVFIFLAIGVGFAAGVQMLMLALLLSVMYNVVTLLIWYYDFGRNALEPTATARWTRSLQELTGTNGSRVPDRELVLALTPTKADELARQFERVRQRLGKRPSKPRYNAVVTATATDVAAAQATIENVLEHTTKRWRLDEVISYEGKPSQLYYLVRARKSMPGDAIVTAIREHSNGVIDEVDVEIGDALTEEKVEERERRKVQGTS